MAHSMRCGRRRGGVCEGEAVALKIIVLFLESHELGVKVPGCLEEAQTSRQVELSRYVQEQLIL